ETMHFVPEASKAEMKWRATLTKHNPRAEYTKLQSVLLRDTLEKGLTHRFANRIRPALRGAGVVGRRRRDQVATIAQVQRRYRANVDQSLNGGCHARLSDISCSGNHRRF